MAPVVNIEKCTGCGICLELCPVKAIVLKDGKAYITVDCVETGFCISECPAQAIS